MWSSPRNSHQKVNRDPQSVFSGALNVELVLIKVVIGDCIAVKKGERKQGY